MFLNKQDLLKDKVLEGHFKIESYFPEYSSYQISNEDSEFLDSVALYSLITDSREPEENDEIRRAKGFIRDLFVVSINVVYLLISDV